MPLHNEIDSSTLARQESPVALSKGDSSQNSSSSADASIRLSGESHMLAKTNCNSSSYAVNTTVNRNDSDRADSNSRNLHAGPSPEQPQGTIKKGESKVNTGPSTHHRSLADITESHTAHAGAENVGIISEQTPAPAPIDNNHGLPGIDVSKFDKTIDWQQVKKDGVQYAFIRATDGTTIQDPTFKTNWNGAENAGIMVGAYHYLTTTSPIKSQIDNFVQTPKKVDAGDLPPVVDVEAPKQWKKYSVNERVNMVQQFLDGVQKETGVQPLLYMSSSFSKAVLNDAPQFNKYKLWVADYTTANQPVVPQIWKDWTFWQHSDVGIVPGIPVTPSKKSEGVDLNYFNGTAAELVKLKSERTVGSNS